MRHRPIFNIGLSMAALMLAAVTPKHPTIMANGLAPQRRLPRRTGGKSHLDRSKYSGADIRRLYAERGITGPRPGKVQ